MSNLNETALHEHYEPRGFKGIIDNLKSRFYTLEEFPNLERDLLPQQILKKAMNIPEAGLRSFAIGLSGKELEGLLLDLRDASGFDAIKRGTELLTIRLSPRILKLLTILYQYHYTSAGLNIALKRIATAREGAFIRRFGAEENKFAAVCSAIDECKRDIDQCFKTYSIHSKSPFAEEAVLAYLNYADKEGLMTNRGWIIGAIDHHRPDQLHQLIKNYLSSFALVEFHDGINLSILHKIGQPYTSPDWESYDLELRDKFAQWSFLHQLKLHSIGFPKKFTVLAKYYEQVRNSYTIREESLMVIDFGDIVLVDISTNPFSFFYEKGAFEKEIDAWQKSKAVQAAWDKWEESIDIWPTEGEEERPEPFVPAFLRIDKKNLTARDFIIEEIEEPCVKLSYEGIDVLYIQEMLDIKMGLEPDMRRKQLAKLRKKDTRR